MTSAAEARPPTSAAAAARSPFKTRDIRCSVRIRATSERVYKSLTSATELCRWWLKGAETDARNGGRFRMVWPKMAARAGRDCFPVHSARGEGEGHFVDLEPGRKVGWLWRLPPIRRFVPRLCSFFIQKRSRGCEVALVHAGFSKKPSADKDYSRAAQGWQDCLAKLKLYLETGRTFKSQTLDFSALEAPRKKKKQS